MGRGRPKIRNGLRLIESGFFGVHITRDKYICERRKLSLVVCAKAELYGRGGGGTWRGPRETVGAGGNTISWVWKVVIDSHETSKLPLAVILS